MALTILPEKGKGQVMAVCMLIIALILFYFVGLHWFFSGHLRVARELQAQQENELRFAQEGKKIPLLKGRLEEIKRFEESNVYFLPETNEDLAIANLTSKLREIVSSTARDQARCQLLSTQKTSSPKPEPYKRVSLQVRMSCDMEDIVRIMYKLETATPLLFLDELNLYPRTHFDSGQPIAGGNMEVRFDVSGYIRIPKNDPNAPTATPGTAVAGLSQ